MAKKTATQAPEIPDGQLGDWQDEIPKAVQEAANAYAKAKRAKQKADEKCKIAAANCVEAMKEHNVPRCRIDNDEKVLTLNVNESLKIEAIKGKEEAA